MGGRLTLPGALALLAACGSSGNGSDAAVPDLATTPLDLAGVDALPLGAPISVPADRWSWVDFPGSSCDDGTPTGIGIFRSSTSSNLMVYLDAGGACWDYATCYVYGGVATGPFGKSEFDAQAGRLASGIFDRSDASNPVRDWSVVFVPYCTGDLHAGNHVVTFDGDGGSRTHRFVGRVNLLGFLARLAATFPTPPKLLVSGSSAGGYGATLNYATFRAYWPQAESYLVADSSPLMESSMLPADSYAAWLSVWKMDALLQTTCGADCVSDWSRLVPSLATSFAGDRLALAESLQDDTISVTTGLGAQFESALRQLVADRFTRAKYFLVPGTQHILLYGIGQYSSVGTTLESWLAQMLGDDPAWRSLSP